MEVPNFCGVGADLIEAREARERVRYSASAFSSHVYHKFGGSKATYHPTASGDHKA
jgi:hypothetical protein